MTQKREDENTVGLLFKLPRLGLNVALLARKIKQQSGRHLTRLTVGIGRQNEPPLAIVSQAQYGKNEVRPFDLLVGAKYAFSRAVSELAEVQWKERSNPVTYDWIKDPGLIPDFRRIGALSLARAAVFFEERSLNEDSERIAAKAKHLDGILKGEGIRLDGERDETPPIFTEGLKKPAAYKNINASAPVSVEPMAEPTAQQVQERVQRILDRVSAKVTPAAEAEFTPTKAYRLNNNQIAGSPMYQPIKVEILGIIAAAFGPELYSKLPAEVDDLATAFASLVVTGVEAGIDIPDAGKIEQRIDAQIKVATARLFGNLGLGR